MKEKISSYPIDGKYGKFGGRFVPEVLMEAITELEKAYVAAKADPPRFSDSWIITLPNS